MSESPGTWSVGRSTQGQDSAPDSPRATDVDRWSWFECYDDPVNAITREKEIKKWRRAGRSH